MKKIILILSIISMFAVTTAFTTKTTEVENITLVSNFCDGWADGYCEGWKDVKGQFAICPVTPICPIAQVGQDNYKSGYNRGFKAGSRAAN